MIRKHAPDALVVIGLLAITWGAWFIYRPAALIVAGLLCVGLALIVERGNHGPTR